ASRGVVADAVAASGVAAAPFETFARYATGPGVAAAEQVAGEEVAEEAVVAGLALAHQPAQALLPLAPREVGRAELRRLIGDLAVERPRLDREGIEVAGERLHVRQHVRRAADADQQAVHQAEVLHLLDGDVEQRGAALRRRARACRAERRVLQERARAEVAAE